MKFIEAVDSCHVRSAIYREEKPGIRYWKNYPIKLEVQIPKQEQIFDDWLEYDPRNDDETSLFSFND